MNSAQTSFPWVGSLGVHAVVLGALSALSATARVAPISDTVSLSWESAPRSAGSVRKSRPAMRAVPEETFGTRPLVQPRGAEANDSFGAADAESTAAGGQVVDTYLAGLRARIAERKIYPSMSRRLGESGRVLIEFAVLRDGSIQNVRVKAGSAYARLNEAAFETVAQVAKYQPLPVEQSGERLVVEVPIEYAL